MVACHDSFAIVVIRWIGHPRATGRMTMAIGDCIQSSWRFGGCKAECRVMRVRYHREEGRLGTICAECCILCRAVSKHFPKLARQMLEQGTCVCYWDVHLRIKGFDVSPCHMSAYFKSNQVFGYVWAAVLICFAAFPWMNQTTVAKHMS